MSGAGRELHRGWTGALNTSYVPRSWNTEMGHTTLEQRVSAKSLMPQFPLGKESSPTHAFWEKRQNPLGMVPDAS